MIQVNRNFVNVLQHIMEKILQFFRLVIGGINNIVLMRNMKVVNQRDIMPVMKPKVDFAPSVNEPSGL